jgi:hypothetical protein
LQFVAKVLVIYPSPHETELSFRDHQHVDTADVNLVAALPQNRVSLE